MNERYYNTPIFDKDVKYCDCEDCNGTGKKYYPIVNDFGDDALELRDCERCDGTGVLEVE